MGKQKVMKCPKNPLPYSKQQNHQIPPTHPPKNTQSSSPETHNIEQLPGLWVLTDSCTHPFVTGTRLQHPAPSPPTAVTLAGWLSEGAGTGTVQWRTLTIYLCPHCTAAWSSKCREADHTELCCSYQAQGTLRSPLHTAQTENAGPASQWAA